MGAVLEEEPNFHVGNLLNMYSDKFGKEWFLSLRTLIKEL